MPDFPTARILGFLLRFVIIYGLLIAPWPGFNAAYSSYFQAIGQAFFGSDGDTRIVRFEPNHNLAIPLDTNIVIGNRKAFDSDGHPQAINVRLDSRGIGWIPTALITALALATALPWRRRLWALFWCLFWVHAFILFSLDIHIWFYSSRVTLVPFSPFWFSLLQGLDYTLINQLGASFSFPVLIWILVTFRGKDLSGREEAASK